MPVACISHFPDCATVCAHLQPSRYGTLHSDNRMEGMNKKGKDGLSGHWLPLSVEEMPPSLLPKPLPHAAELRSPYISRPHNLPLRLLRPPADDELSTLPGRPCDWPVALRGHQPIAAASQPFAAGERPPPSKGRYRCRGQHFSDSEKKCGSLDPDLSTLSGRSLLRKRAMLGHLNAVDALLKCLEHCDALHYVYTTFF